MCRKPKCYYRLLSVVHPLPSCPCGKFGGAMSLVGRRVESGNTFLGSRVANLLPHAHCAAPLGVWRGMTPQTPSGKARTLPAAVEILGSPYYKGVPLPRIPITHKLDTSSRIALYISVGPQGTHSHVTQLYIGPRRQHVQQIRLNGTTCCHDP